ncbi:MAG: thiamine pyrophosphate-dependent enzyme [bacterium]|nr:thiamine pyrophosphate-dependent enzyme [bacterium]
MKQVFSKPESLTEAKTIYCSGCGHGLVHRLIAEAIDELGLRERTVGVVPVGCAVLGYDYFNFDTTEAAHGRTPAVATGIKRVLPQNLVFSYQGDGDLAAIGTAEIIHVANRGERITVIFVNNAVYGMTGGQMAPTTLLGQKTATTPKGRDARLDGFPLKISELLALLDGSVYLERTTVNSPNNIRKTKQAITKAFELQMNDIGFTMVEILSMCPTDWNLTPLESAKWIDEVMTTTFPLGVIKDINVKV